MASLQGLAPLEARRFRTGRPALDLAHTGGDGPLAVWELLFDAADLTRWLGVVTGVPGIVATDADVGPTRRLRRAIWRAAHAAIEGRAPADRERGIINDAAAAAPIAPRLTPRADVAVRAPVTVEAVLSTLARDAIELFGSPLATRIRVCAAADCQLLFLDASRPGRRRWCSMQRCGNRAKARTHRERDRA